MPSRHVADIRQVEGKTGRKVEEWCELLEANGVGDRREAVNLLRDGYAVSHAFALAIADECLRRPRDDDDFGDASDDDAEDGPLVSSARAARRRTDRDAAAGSWRADGRRYAFADHNCFACGETNPIGMHLHIELGEGRRQHDLAAQRRLRGLGGQGPRRACWPRCSTR